jgi:sugar phosphate isomerase/epimerase
MNRRDFIATNLASIPVVSALASSGKTNEPMKTNVLFFCPRWGADDSWDSFCKRVKEAGYDGVEAGVSSPEAPEANEVLDALRKHGLSLVGQYYQSAEADIEQHASNYEKYLRRLAAMKPLFINAQTGKDYFTFAQNKRLIDIAARVAVDTGVEIVHETHRGKALFAAHITRPFLDQLPAMKLTLDISHWCNVHESLMHDQVENVDVALGRTRHIHSRVGHPEGPQVNDPRASEWKDVIDAHLQWWDKVAAIHQKNGTTLTITTEFGPPDYMPVLPFTRQPVASQWDINVHMMKLLKARYQ